MDTAILDTLLNSIATVCIGSQGTLMGHARSLFGILIAIDFILAIIFSLLQFGHGPNYIALTVKKILTYGFWLWVITNWGSLCNTVLESLSEAGLAVGGGSIAVLNHPSSIIDAGIARTSSVFDYVYSLEGMDFVRNMGIGLTALLVGFATLIAYAIIAFQVFITYVEFYITSALMLIFIPFATNKYTERFAQNCIGGVIAQGTKLMFLGALVSITSPILNSISGSFSGTPSWEMLFSLAIAPWAVAYLAWQAPAIASGFMSGGPSLSAGSMVSGGAAAVGGFMGGASGAMSAVGAAARGGSGVAGAAMSGATSHGATSTAGAALGAVKGVGNFAMDKTLGSSIDSFKHNQSVGKQNPFERRQVNADGSPKRTPTNQKDSDKYGSDD